MTTSRQVEAPAPSSPGPSAEPARQTLRSKLPKRPALGWWAMLALSLVAATAFYTDVARFANPIGEKYVPAFAPGQSDFGYAYFGARALGAGVNPYHNNRPEFANPNFAVEMVDGVRFTQLYPPGYLITILPLVVWKGVDWQAAARVWFRFNVAIVFALAVLTWTIARRAVALPLTPLWIPFICACLMLNPSEELGLERGQADGLIALLCWAAAYCFLRGWSGIALFVAAWGTTIKGYPVLFGFGLGLLGLRGGRWPRTLAGSLAAAATFTLPAARYLGDAVHAMRYRSDMFLPYWFNHSFRNLVFRFSPALADKGRTALSAFAFLVAAAAFVRAWRAFSRETASSQALWLAVFATASLGTMIGYSALSVSYDLALLFPGALILAFSQERLRTVLALPWWAKHALGATLLGCLFLLFICRLGDNTPAYEGDTTPAAAYGIVMLFVILAALCARGLLAGQRAEGSSDLAHDHAPDLSA
jgi:hypothetical protein